MKQLKKITTMIMALGIFSFCFCAEAARFGSMDIVRDDVWRSVSGFNSASIVAVCEAKINILRELLPKDIVCARIPELAGTYMERCRISQKSHTAEQLKRSGNIGDFRYNVDQIISAYQEIKTRYSSSAPALKKPADTPSSKRHHLTKCPNRKGEYNTGGRRGHK